MKSFFGWLGIGFLSIPVALACGCGSNDTNPGTGGAGGAGGGAGHETLEAACEDQAKAYCAYYAKCSPIEIKISYGDAASCEAELAAWCTGAYGRADVTATPSQLAACGDSIHTETCDASAFPACEFKGSAADASGCYDAADCQSGMCWVDYSCSDPSGICPFPKCGTCINPKAGGQPCKLGQCGEGLFCNATNVCAKEAARGQSCESFGCTGIDNCVNGKCAAPPEVGDACDDTTGVFCDSNAWLECDSTNHCVAPKVVGLGASCAFNANTDTFAYCVGGTTCDQKTQLCVKSVADGGACQIDKSTGLDNCTWPSSCQAGKCSAAPPACK